MLIKLFQLLTILKLNNVIYYNTLQNTIWYKKVKFLVDIIKNTSWLIFRTIRLSQQISRKWISDDFICTVEEYSHFIIVGTYSVLLHMIFESDEGIQISDIHRDWFHSCNVKILDLILRQPFVIMSVDNLYVYQSRF